MKIRNILIALLAINIILPFPAYSQQISPVPLLDACIERWDKLRDEQNAVNEQISEIEKDQKNLNYDTWMSLNNRCDELQADLDAAYLDLNQLLSNLVESKQLGSNKKIKEVKPESSLKGMEKYAKYLKEEANNYISKGLVGQIEGINGQMKARYWLRGNRLQQLGARLLEMGKPRLSLQARLSLQNLGPALAGEYIQHYDPDSTPLEVGIAYFYSGEMKKAKEYAETAFPPGAKERKKNLFLTKKYLLQALIAESQGDYEGAIKSMEELMGAQDVLYFELFFPYAFQARCYAKANNIPMARSLYNKAILMKDIMLEEKRPRAEGDLAEIEVLMGDYDAASKRLSALETHYADTNRLDGARQLLLRSLLKTKENKLAEAEADLNRCKGWLDELPTLDNWADTAVKALSDARGAKFPLNTPVRNKFALIIGVGQFKDATIPKLRYADKDAVEMRDMLVQNYGFKPENIKLLTNAQATKAAVLDSLRDNWLPKSAGSDDLVLLFVSSHGTPAHRDLGARNYVVLHDTNKRELFSTSIAMEQLCKMLRTRCKARRTLVIADTCYSGGLALEGDKQTNIDPAEYVMANSMLVLSSSDVNQRSWESKRYENGVFTRQLIESFKKNRNYNEFKQIFDDLRQKTAQEVKEDDKADQTPCLGGIWKAADVGK